MKRCGKSAPASEVTRAAWQTPPGARSSVGRPARPMSPGRPLRWMTTHPACSRWTESRLQAGSLVLPGRRVFGQGCTRNLGSPGGRLNRDRDAPEVRGCGARPYRSLGRPCCGCGAVAVFSRAASRSLACSRVTAAPSASTVVSREPRRAFRPRGPGPPECCLGGDLRSPPFRARAVRTRVGGQPPRRRSPVQLRRSRHLGLRRP